MSRNINPKTSLTISEEETAARNTGRGKLLFTHYRERSCALLIQNDRLTAAAFPEASKVGAIYVAKVKNVVKNIDACFVEISAGELCFLPLKEAASPFLLNRKYDGRILEGDELPVQVTRDAQKTKQASVTAHISLSNDYFALALGPTRVGYSAKLDKSAKEQINTLFTNKGIFRNGKLVQDIDEFIFPSFGCIVRTKAGEIVAETDNFLLEQFHSVLRDFVMLLHTASHRVCFSCLREPVTSFETVLQQLVADSEYEEIVTDDEDFFQELQTYSETHDAKALRLYQDKVLSLSKLYALDSKLETALEERVWLKSGGYLIIQPTEALTVIDVNSGKYEAGKESGEESALKVNLEAAEEVALQLRLRNLSGIIIVDFINMESEEHQKELINCLKARVRRDKVKTTVVDMTALGLVEITRKKIMKPLREQFQAIQSNK